MGQTVETIAKALGARAEGDLSLPIEGAAHQLPGATAVGAAVKAGQRRVHTGVDDAVRG